MPHTKVIVRDEQAESCNAENDKKFNGVDGVRKTAFVLAVAFLLNSSLALDFSRMQDIKIPHKILRRKIDCDLLVGLQFVVPYARLRARDRCSHIHLC